MKNILLAICVLLTGVLTAQSSFTEKDAKKLIDTFFEGFHTGDTLLMKSTIAPTMVMQTAFSTPTGEDKVTTGTGADFLNAIANRPANQQWDEKLLGYSVQIDGNLAHVWTPYEFYANGNFSHCGANAFTLAKMDSGWKIIHIIDSRRTASCKE
jgi:hypothetical protein